MKNSVPTKVPTFYTLVDNNKRAVVGDFKTLVELVKFGQNYTQRNYGADLKDMLTMSRKITSITLRVFIPYHDDSIYSFWTNRTYRNLYVVDSMGELVRVFETKKQFTRYYWSSVSKPNQHRDLRDEINQQIRQGLVIKNHNVDKIKSAYHNTLRKTTWRAMNEAYYCTVTSSWRRVRTAQARRMAVNVCTDEGEPEFRGARNKRAVPTSWDEVYKSVHDNYKSWKHNSKRRKQWKPKAST